MLIEFTDDFALFNSWVRLTTVFSEQADFTGKADCPQVDLLASFPSVGIQASLIAAATLSSTLPSASASVAVSRSCSTLRSRVIAIETNLETFRRTSRRSGVGLRISR